MIEESSGAGAGAVAYLCLLQSPGTLMQPKSPIIGVFGKDRQYQTVKLPVATGTLAQADVMSRIGIYKLLDTQEMK